MERTEQERGRSLEQDAGEHRRRSPQRPGRQSMAAVLQALRAGAPVHRLPPEAVLALSGGIGNQALLDYLGERSGAVRPAPFHPPERPLKTGAYPVPELPAVPAAGPGWSGLPALETAAAAPRQIAAGGGGLAGE